MTRTARIADCLLVLLILLSPLALRQPAPPIPLLQVDALTAYEHELAPHRHRVSLGGLPEGFEQLEIALKISPLGTVVRAVPASDSRALKFWPLIEYEVRGWKYKPFAIDGRPVAAEFSAYVNFFPPEIRPRIHVPPPALLPESKIAITLLRTGCMGSCPAYKVELTPEGVLFHGYDFVAAPGRHTAAVDPAQVRALARKFLDSDFYSMASKYAFGATDAATYTLTVEIDGHRKEVIDYLGNEMGMPEVIADLEEEVDRLAATERWIKGDGLMEALRQEHYNFNSFEAQAMARLAAMRGETALLGELLTAGVPTSPLPAPKLPQFEPESWAYEHLATVGWLNASVAHPETLNFVIQRGLSRYDQLDKDIALAGALQEGALERARQLIAYGANPQADLSGHTFYFGRIRERWEEHGAGSMLIYAAHSGNPEMVRELLRYRPRLDARDSRGQTALYGIGNFSHQGDPVNVTRCLELLLAAGVPANAQDEEGKTALQRSYEPDVAEILLRHGADPNLRDKDGETALFGYWQDPMAALLLAHGADPAIRNHKGKTALQVLEAEDPDRARTLRDLIARHKPRPPRPAR